MNGNLYSNQFKLKFDGQLHQIDANILINSLIHTTSVIQEINNELNSGKKIETKIKALERGSFLVHLEIIESFAEQFSNIFTRENIETASYIVLTLVGLLQIKKLLKGKKEKSIQKDGDSVSIENMQGDVITVKELTFNIYTHNTIVNDALSQNFETINSDPSIIGFEITDCDENPLVRIEKEDFEDLSIKSEIVEDNVRIITEGASLNIIKLSFDDKYKWEFYYKGNKISAKICDNEFNDLIDLGKSFAKGDRLEVELQLTQIFEQAVNTYINKSYQVNKVTRHIPRGEQQTLRFEE
ncbi:MAG: hypothetical protein COW85_04995 [Ignavibacteria bacterium CG22_combo_CG10-13_8_21_14_all_37_15]|nr:MAG: hypothetical protein COW85_04995 [Ignavibacteria bacterium CG22_combo_CG10-13_8_21_14_all_37_15]